MRVSGVTLAGFGGPGACGGEGVFALGNHQFAPDASHPHFFSEVGGCSFSGSYAPDALTTPAG